MPLFISEEEFRQSSHDAALVAEKADSFIRDLYIQIETVKAQSDASSITAEQTCSLIEQKYVSLSAEFSSLQSQHSELNSSLEQRALELGQLQSEKQQLLLQSIEKDGVIERLSRESSELHKSKRQLMEMLEQKDLEISEKNATMKSYLDKIVNLTESVSSKEARLGDVESELARLNATSSRYLQEKELLERHNTWLNEELTAKVNDLIQLRKTNGELEADMSTKLADVEKKFKESSSSLKFHKDRVKELEEKLTSMEDELLSTKDAAAAAEDRFSAEISTVTKLADLYKESSEEWSNKAGELEGVIKALETHLNQVEYDYKDKLEKESSSRKEVEKELAELKVKLQASESELEKLKNESESKHLPLSNLITNSWEDSVHIGEIVSEDDRAIVPTIPAGVSGTALAASLLRDGWSLAKMYAKYQETVDALRHEQLGRKQAQAILERVLYEIEEKAGVIMDEREEHARLVEAYSALNQKLHHSLSEHSAFETTIQGLKASLKRHERDYAVAQKEIVDLQKQVAVLLKECRDVQLRCGSVARNGDELGLVALLNPESDAENIISERLLTFKDINGLVEQNVQLRSLEKFEKELQKQTDETASKVNAVLLRAEEQGNMIESLHNSVAMYKKLYEEEHKRRSSYPHPLEAVPDQGSREIVLLHDTSHETSSKAQEQAFERVNKLEEDLAESRTSIMSLRAERDKLSLEAQFAQEKLARFMKDFEHQREEFNGVISRNVEFSQLIVDYQKKLRESSESVNASDERSRKLTMEVSILKNEKEILKNSEKRASDEVRSLSERLYRLQASLDTIQSTEEARQEARGIEKRKQEEYTKKIEREWAEAKKELQEERDNVRNLTLERESSMNNALRQVEELSKELANALQSVAVAESRAAVAEARYSDLEKIMESVRTKDSDDVEGSQSTSASEKILANLRDEIEKLRVEAQASKDHMLQYKSIAQVNEAALKQMESAHENLKTEADEVRRSLEAEVHSLRDRLNELENECKLKTEEARSATAGKEDALASSLSEIASLKDDCSFKKSEIVVMETQISALKEDLEKEHQRWRAAQDNYERQVILQSETIQELTKTSQVLASLQEETSELRRVVDVLKTEKSQLTSKWEAEKLAIDVYKNEADKKYSEVNELNKILHSRLEALHIKLADKELGKASGSSSQTFGEDDGLQNVVNYLRRSKEIAETEISLLRQEKLRLQSQLESALKSAGSAQTSLNSERAKSRASLFTEEDFKSLQLQVRELTLLRESNIQLREENRHNFEESQRLREAFQNVRIETENLEKLLRDRETELETRRKEIEFLETEKGNLQKRIDELVDKCKDVDLDDYNRMKESYQQLQVNVREKDAELEEIKKLLSEKQDQVSVLERDLARSRTELSERETRINEILQAKASLQSEIEKIKQSEIDLKSEIDRYKRANAQLRRKSDNLVKEKDDLSKEMQSLSKQLEDAKQVKRSVVDSAGEQALREKEKEKDTRIQILEKTLERHREDLRKEKEDHHKEKERSEMMRKTIIETRDTVYQQKKRITTELNKHKQALKVLQDEVEKLKNSLGSRSESTPMVQHIATTVLDDVAAAYFQAVKKFEQVTQPAFSELDSATSADAPAPPLDNTSTTGAIVGQTATSSNQTLAAPAANVPSTRTSDDRERRIAITKSNFKMGRKLVRPNITKPKEPQGDVEMPEVDESNTGLSSQNTETQGNITLPTPPIVRKRSSASSDLPEGNLAPEEASSDILAPLLKKSKPSEDLQESIEEPSSDPVKLPEVVEEPLDDVENLQQGSKEEPVEAERDESETAGELMDEPTADEQIQAELLSDPNEVAEEKLDKPSEAVLSDDQLRDQTEQDMQRIITESSEREEGELVFDFADNDRDSNVSDLPGSGDNQAERESAEPENSPGIETEALEAGEIDSPPQTPEEDKNDGGGDTTENIVESSHKLHNVADSTPETDQVPDSSNSNTTTEEASEQGGKPVSPLNSGGGSTINLQERARQRASIRQAGRIPSSPSRARGRAVRGRVARGGRTPRGQSPG
ncbi:hypothetical protein RD792_007563 [Penstemon davidsonii]|uniref:Nucleoprotein TPR/MLP1 domain-containing protein n=1 Tax=Penstemon davidsonii TaxID=160366 RepID=A0ABR0D8K1_9LAMI|nr:hypothetical protein RD792_007563 [Penstemon davidsonii]